MNCLKGSELIVDAGECEGILDNLHIYNCFVSDLCRLAKMQMVGNLIHQYFPYTPYNIERDLCGFTIIQIVSLSSITLHIAEISKTIYFNFHTCGDLEVEKVINLFKDYFKPTKINFRLIERAVI